MVEIDFDCDFADIFEVKESRVELRGDVVSRRSGTTAWFTVDRPGFVRGVELDFGASATLTERTAQFTLELDPGASWSTCILVTPWFDSEAVEPRYGCGVPVARSAPARRIIAWRRALPSVESEDQSFARVLHRSTEDLASLRIFDPDDPGRAVIAAGAPWFMTLFGRDSILTGWMALLVDPALALGILETLAQFQGRDVDPTTEEQPGRILHEMRFGEQAKLALGGGRIYYGTVDATPLYVMLLGELSRWGTAPEGVQRLLPAADRCLEPGYETSVTATVTATSSTSAASTNGLVNQGWKDSWDGVRFADGRLATGPIALCEVQGYVHAAFTARANLALADGDLRLSEELTERAAVLKASFNRRLLGRRARVVRDGPRRRQAQDRRARVEHRALPLDRHRRRRERTGCRRPTLCRTTASPAGACARSRRR